MRHVPVLYIDHLEVFALFGSKVDPPQISRELASVVRILDLAIDGQDSVLYSRNSLAVHVKIHQACPAKRIK